MRTMPDYQDGRWLCEPALEDLLRDPILMAVAARDGMSVEHLRRFAADMGRRLAPSGR